MQNIITANNTNLKLYRFSEDFISDQYVSWLNNKELMRYSRQRRTAHTKESCLAYLKAFDGSPNHFFAVVDTIDNRHVGNISVYIDVYTNIADIAIVMGERQANGKGYGKQAWGLTMAYLFESLNIRKITAGTMACNIGMIKVAQHWGMQQEAQLRQQDIYEGSPVDVVKFGILKAEWDALPHKVRL